MHYNSYHVVSSVVTEQKNTFDMKVVLVGSEIFLEIKVGPGSKKVENHFSR